jgi:hypothetical protein
MATATVPMVVQRCTRAYLSDTIVWLLCYSTQKAEQTDLPCFVRWPLRRDVGEEFALKRAVNARCLEHRALVDLRQQLTAQTLRWASVHARAALRTHRAVTGGRAAAAQLNAAKGRAFTIRMLRILYYRAASECFGACEEATADTTASPTMHR